MFDNGDDPTEEVPLMGMGEQLKKARRAEKLNSRRADLQNRRQLRSERHHSPILTDSLDASPLDGANTRRTFSPRRKRPLPEPHKSIQQLLDHPNRGRIG